MGVSRPHDAARLIKSTARCARDSSRSRTSQQLGEPPTPPNESQDRVSRFAGAFVVRHADRRKSSNFKILGGASTEAFVGANGSTAARLPAASKSAWRAARAS